MTARLILPVARKLQPMLDEVVFLGGSVVELLLTDPAAQNVRPTRDVDFVVSVSSRLEYAKLGERLKALGFVEDVQDKVICRWTDGTHILDAMPTKQEILGFSNPGMSLLFRLLLKSPYQD